MALYSHKQPSGLWYGRYASKLEWEWAVWLERAAGWDARYIGASCNWADFDLGPIRLEVKPEGQEFLLHALGRIPSGRHPVLIVSGQPHWSPEWWLTSLGGDGLNMARRVPKPQRFPGNSGHGPYPRTQTIHEYMEEICGE